MKYQIKQRDMKKKVSYRPATLEDFKVGTVLVSTEGEYKFPLKAKYDEGIWDSEQTVVFEKEVRFYKVAI